MRGGAYHPINPKVLLGGSRRGQEYDEDDTPDGYFGGASSSSAVSKKFVSPTLGSNGSAGEKKPQACVGLVCSLLREGRRSDFVSPDVFLGIAGNRHQKTTRTLTRDSRAATRI
jgi:hypothetical protein